LLSKRERLIAAKFAEGLTYQEIGEALCIAPTTVRTHLATIYRKLAIHNKAALINLVVEHRALESSQAQDDASTLSSELAEGGSVEEADRTDAASRIERRLTAILAADVAAWLREQGFERYEPAFHEHEIGWEVLPELTEADLEKLGLPLGPRKKLLKAIAGLSTGPAVASSEAAAPPRRVIPKAERRQLTVMFVDLVGSTVLAARLDPEDLREVIGAYYRCVAEIVGRFGGHVAKLMGDGVLGYFGWPRAHEDAAERAVRAGLGIVEAVPRLATPAGEPLAARVGIATGLVVVGDLAGEGAGQEEAVVGETPNLAARLQDRAGPGQVVMAAGTRRLLGDLFDLESLGPLALKGFAEPMRAWRVSGLGEAEGRFEALRSSTLTPLVGRDVELGLLLDRWRRAAAGEGQAVLLQGEPGVGKSRLALALRERLRDQPRTRLSYACSPHHANSVLWPVIRQLERAADFGRDDPPPIRLAKLADLLRQALPDVAEVLPLVAELLSIPTEAGYAPLDLMPQQRKVRTCEALLAQLEGLAARRPVLVVLEDVHWLDPTSRELFDQVVERLRLLPVLLVATLRPDITTPWTGFPHTTLLTLGRLARSEAGALAAQTAGAHALPDDVLERILARAEGVPLFVEELTKAVLETGLPGAGDDCPEGGRPVPADVPASLHDTLMARLDRLAPVKEVAQVGAVIGREFPHWLLAAVADLPEERLEEAAGQLVGAGLVFRRGAGPEPIYSFKHALVRDAAYQSLLRSRRQLLHGRIAVAIERRFPESASTSPEILALHLEEGGRTLEAAARWHEAAGRAEARAAYIEARNYLERTLSLVPPERDDPPSLRQRLGSLLALANVWRNIEGPPSRAAAALSEEIMRLAEAVGDRDQRFAACWNAWASHQYMGRFAEARRELGSLHRLAGDDAGDERELPIAHASWTTHFYTGRLDASARAVERGLGLCDPVRHRAHRFTFGAHDPGVCCRATGGLVAWLRGRPEQADCLAEEAVALGVELRHGFSLGIALGHRTILAHYSRRPELVPELLEETDRWVERGELAPHYRFLGDFVRMWWAAATGREDVDLDRLRSAVALLRERQAFRISYQLALAAETALLCGEPLQAWDWLDEALAFEAATGERFWLAEIYRLRAACATAGLAAAGKPEPHLANALRAARDTGASSLELRAAADVARLWAERGKRRKARDLLEPVFGRFTEGFDTPDLMASRALLDAL
jgi:class 3 adenylate cyclase/DNA-binding CsgD family transcriptional regulator